MSQPSDLSDIAVVIPVLNQLSFTKNCLASLNEAGLADAQIIIVNNGSTDGTREFLDSQTKPSHHSQRRQSRLRRRLDPGLQSFRRHMDRGHE